MQDHSFRGDLKERRQRKKRERSKGKWPEGGKRWKRTEKGGRFYSISNGTSCKLSGMDSFSCTCECTCNYNRVESPSPRWKDPTEGWKKNAQRNNVGLDRRIIIVNWILSGARLILHYFHNGNLPSQGYSKVHVSILNGFHPFVCVERFLLLFKNFKSAFYQRFIHVYVMYIFFKIRSNNEDMLDIKRL